MSKKIDSESPDAVMQVLEQIGAIDHCRHKHREEAEYTALLRRLSRIEGQVRGVRGMVEKEAYCTDILTQVSAIQSALDAFARELLADRHPHLRGEGYPGGTSGGHRRPPVHDTKIDAIRKGWLLCSRSMYLI